MYHDFYKLRVMPFENTPDPRFFFASEQHKEALAAVEYTIRMRKGYVLITGEIGSGKTTVGRTMCQRCGDYATIVPVMHGHQGADELIRQVLRGLNLPIKRRADHTSMLTGLQAHLQEQLRRQRPVVLFVDEAQTLGDESLEELRLLSNFDTANDKLIQVVLIGQPELRQRIREERMAALRQRIVLAKDLRPLSALETGQYVAHRFRVASIDPNHVAVGFTPEAVYDIHSLSHGIPRLINVISDNCLLMGFVQQARRIDQPIVQRVAGDMLPSFGDAPSFGPSSAAKGRDAGMMQQPLRLAGGM